MSVLGLQAKQLQQLLAAGSLKRGSLHSGIQLPSTIRRRPGVLQMHCMFKGRSKGRSKPRRLGVPKVGKWVKINFDVFVSKSNSELVEYKHVRHNHKFPPSATYENDLPTLLEMCGSCVGVVWGLCGSWLTRKKCPRITLPGLKGPLHTRWSVGLRCCLLVWVGVRAQHLLHMVRWGSLPGGCQLRGARYVAPSHVWWSAGSIDILARCTPALCLWDRRPVGFIACVYQVRLNMG